METEADKVAMGKTEQEGMEKKMEEAKRKSEAWKEEAAVRSRRFIEQRKGVAAEFVKDIAGAMEAAAAELEQRDRKTAGDYLRTASREVHRWSDSITGQEVDTVARQMQDFAGRHPGLLLGGAMVAGFAVTRLFRSADRSDRPAGATESQQTTTAASEELYGQAAPGYQPPPAEEYGPHS